MAQIFSAPEVEIAWCPGCGNFGILKALQETLEELGYTPNQVVLVSGIGQAAKTPHYLKANVFNGLHGRSIPVAFAIKAVRPELCVIAESGDGCMYGEGGNHLLHVIRRNPDITVLVHNNQVYGLTKGQASPTSEEGFMTKAQPWGNLSRPLNPLSLAISQGASFVARAFAGDVEGLKNILKRAITFHGFALVDILQPCVTFNRVNTYSWYRERIYYLGEDHNPADPLAAFQKSLEWGERIPLGVFYTNPKPTYEDRIRERKGKQRDVFAPDVFDAVLKKELAKFC